MPAQQPDGPRTVIARHGLKSNGSDRPDGKMKRILTIDNGAFGALGATAMIRMNAMKHNVNKNVEKVKTRVPKPSVFPMCVLSTTMQPTESYRALSGPRGNTLFTSHNWGGHRK